MANLKVLAGATITFAMPDGLKITWTAESDTNTSHLMDVVARFETAADVPARTNEGA